MNALAKEIKGIDNHHYFPEAFFMQVLPGEAKTAGCNGDSFKDGRATLMSLLHPWIENQQASALAPLVEAVAKQFGYSGSESKPDMKRFKHRQHSYEIEVSYIDELINGTELYIINQMHQAAASGDWLQEDVSVEERQSKCDLAWEHVVEGLFDEHDCSYLIINRGFEIILVQRDRWYENQGYLHISLNELLSINSKDSYRIAEALFFTSSFEIKNKASKAFHQHVERVAERKAAEVTKDLRDRVRTGIELLVNYVLETHQKRPLSALTQYDLTNESQRNAAAEDVFDQALRYVYRILFLLFCESQEGKAGALPVHARVYQRGYAMEKLRELEGIPLLDSSGNFIQQTLDQVCSVYFNGYRVGQEEQDALGFSFPAIGTDLFDPKKTPLFSACKINDGSMQQVLQSFSLAQSGTGKKKRTYRVHYATLGLNQLGAVYEGLLSLKPLILAEDVILLNKDKKEPAARFIPVSQQHDVKKADLHYDENKCLVTRKEGQFVLAPIGFERKFSASFYTPEVLTRFMVKEAVQNLLKDDDSLTRMENLKIIEPAMGSGAFLNAVVNALAAKMALHYRNQGVRVHEDYLTKHPNKKDQAPALHSLEFYTSKAKEHLMTHSVYGVDLNPTAVELARISLWLNCLHEDGNLPFLDFRLRLGNSLMGGWVTKHHVDGACHFLKPSPLALNVHLDSSFLGKKKMPFIDDPNLLSLVKERQASWKKDNPHLQQRYHALQLRIDDLYQKHLAARVHYRTSLLETTDNSAKQALFDEFKNTNHPYNQLRAMMDLWSALWVWPSEELKHLPTSEDYLLALEWYAEVALAYGGQERADQEISSGFNFLETARQVALKQRFFHFDLEFAEVFDAGGFDLVLGNPPWAPVRWEEGDFFEQVLPGSSATKGSSSEKEKRYLELLESDVTVRRDYKAGKINAMGFKNFMSQSATYPFVDHSTTNTYKYFYQRFYQCCGDKGTFAMLAQDGIVRDNGNRGMRADFYRNLTRMYRFHNELKLFSEVDNHVEYTVKVFIKEDSNDIEFDLIDNLYHPETVSDSYDKRKLSSQAIEDLPYPGMKDANGKWQLQGHPDRIVRIDQSVLEKLCKFTGSSNALETSLPIIHGMRELHVLTRLAAHPRKMAASDIHFWRKFDETGAPKEGLIEHAPGKATTLNQLVFKGPNVFVANPCYQDTGPTAKNNRDYIDVNLETAPPGSLPKAVFCITEKGLASDKYHDKTPWGTEHKDHWRILSKEMVGTCSIRTLQSCIIPPGPSHIHALISLSFKSDIEMITTEGLFNSLIFDYLMRATCGGHISQTKYRQTPTLTQDQLNNPIIPHLIARTLRLNCVSTHYAPLWHEQFDPRFQADGLQSHYAPKLPYAKLTAKWSYDTCIRNPDAREQALCEIDSMVALLFDFELGTLIDLYTSQFGVLQKNMRARDFDRVAQMTAAYQHFNKYRIKKAS